MENIKTEIKNAMSEKKFSLIDDKIYKLNYIRSKTYEMY